ncbi:MAG: B12-binding domain-containing radical SAM protein [Acidobacteria bacterium]|nr:B12-binding domain-containing radical SAM protein [Acidobacteriota bacterium]
MTSPIKSQSIVLVEPSSGLGGCYTFAGHNEFEPLGLEYVAAYLQMNGYRTVVLRQGTASCEEIATQILRHQPAVLGMSVMTHAATSAAMISAVVKNANSSITIVAGGYHPSGDPEYARTQGIDYAVIGEGEETFRNLLDSIESSREPATVQGLRFLRDGAIVDTGPANRIGLLDAIPFPLRSSEILGNARMHGLMSPPPSLQRSVAVVLASRGCPHACTFCCSPSLWGRKVNYRSPENVLTEIDDLVQRFHTNALFFSDLTFNVSNSRVQELCKHLSSYKKMPRWYSMCTTTGLEAKTLELMSVAGCSKIGFGIESLSQETLHNIGKRKIFHEGELNTTLAACDSLGILTKGYLIIGYPWESALSLEQFKEAVLCLPIDEIRISFFTPFPGSEAFKQFEASFVTRDWSKFNAIRDLVISNDNGLTDETLKAFRQEVFRIFYGSPTYQRRVQCKIQRHPELRPAFDEFFAFLKSGGVLP